MRPKRLKRFLSILVCFLLLLVWYVVIVGYMFILPRRVDPASVSQIPTAEYLFESRSENAPESSIYINPRPGSVLKPGDIIIGVRIPRHIFQQMGFDKEKYSAIMNTVKLEVNQQQIELFSFGEVYIGGGESMADPMNYGAEFYGNVSLSEGLYVVTLSAELPDGNTFSESWAYRVVDS